MEPVQGMFHARRLEFLIGYPKMQLLRTHIMRYVISPDQLPNRISSRVQR